MSSFEMTKLHEALDFAITSMQRVSKKLTESVDRVLVPGELLTAAKLKELKGKVEYFADILDKDSCTIQEIVDSLKNGKMEEPPLDYDSNDELTLSPWSVTEEEDHGPVSVKDHIEEFWGVDYDSDHMPNISDRVR
jgi:seryl-tRNA synthetase